MKKTFWLLACFGIISACSCKKTSVEPAFQNSFSCKINGQLWEPNGKDGFFGFQKTLSFFFAPGETGLGVQADNKAKNQFLTIHSLCKAEKGSYPLRNFSFRDFSKNCSYQRYDTLTSMLSITSIDSIKRIITGTFNCTAYNSGFCNDTLIFSDGKFELNY